MYSDYMIYWNNVNYQLFFPVWTSLGEIEI